MTGSHIARTDESKRNAIAGSRTAVASEGGRRNNAWQGKPSGKERTGFQKVAAISGVHCFSESVGRAILIRKVIYTNFLCSKRKTHVAHTKMRVTHASGICNALHTSGIRAAGQGSERLSRHTHGRPFAHQYSAVPLIKSDGVFVPVQDRPFKASASPGNRQIGHLLEKCRSEARPRQAGST